MTFGRRIAVVAAIAVVFFQGACQMRLKLMLVNGLDVSVKVSVGNDTVTIGPGGSDSVYYPDPEGSEHGSVRLQLPSCSVQYLLPNTVDDYPWRREIKDALFVALRSDLKLYAIPPKTVSGAAVGDFFKDQHGAFPIAPASGDCKASH